MQAVNKHLQKKGSRLSGLAAHCAKLRTLDICIQAILSPPLSDHIRVANFHHGQLILHIDSAAWRTRLQFQLTALLTRLSQEESLSGLRDIQIKTRPAQHDAAYDVTEPNRLPPSQESTAFLREFARHGTCDPRISKALERIASRADRSLQNDLTKTMPPESEY